ncbi:MAG: glycosyl hydrolase family 32 [Clostridia bacterium]|nr:glycosyl hydrolase family 32 [Clostridia bacterium]
MAEKLYNNVILEDDFTREPSRPNDIPYLKNPPEIINITVGRQLFVDNFLIEETDLVPEYHKAVKYEGNPVMKPETEWETCYNPSVTPKGGGVWYDEEEKIFKMWYEACWLHQMCYATSKDGIHWDRPELDVVPGTNKILMREHPSDPSKGLVPLRPDSNAVFIDYDAPREQRYKMLNHGPVSGAGGHVCTSPDGIHWTIHNETGICDDRTTMFYNPFRKKWVYSLRYSRGSDLISKDDYLRTGRCRDYVEADDFIEGSRWAPGDRRHWMSADKDDIPDPYILNAAVSDTEMAPQLYSVDCVGYESIMLGMFEIHQGLGNFVHAQRGTPKITDLIPMYSRDGYHFSRPCRDPFIWSTRVRGSWDRGYVQPVGGVCIINGDELWIYYSGFAGDERYFITEKGDDNHTGMYRNGATGLAKLRRDGFVSMNGSGSLLTRKLEFSGKRTMGINAVGSVRVHICDENGGVIASSAVFEGDSTNHTLDFGNFDISSLNNKVFRLKFEVDGKLYSFGFADENGDFGGAHAAGIVDRA